MKDNKKNKTAKHQETKKDNLKNKTAKRQKKNNKYIKIILLVLILILAICILLYSSTKIILWNINNNKNKEIKEEISSYIKVTKTKENQDYMIDFENLKQTNEDIVGFLKVNETDIEYIVVKGNNNQYYLNHSFDKSYNGAGWIFADYRNKFDGFDKNIIIYGHNRKDGSMFGTLKNVLESSWYDKPENRIITFITEERKFEYEIFSIYEVEENDDYIKTNFSVQEFEQFKDKIKKDSIKDFDSDIIDTETILTLSTCSKDSRHRIVVHAKQIN